MDNINLLINPITNSVASILKIFAEHSNFYHLHCNLPKSSYIHLSTEILQQPPNHFPYVHNFPMVSLFLAKFSNHFNEQVKTCYSIAQNLLISHLSQSKIKILWLLRIEINLFSALLLNLSPAFPLLLPLIQIHWSPCISKRKKKSQA